MTKKVLFVCLGNICRSPTAHAVFRHKAKARRLSVEIESAGTSAYHQGAKPDQRSIAIGRERGYDFSAIYSRPIKDQDFMYYDEIYAMDASNLADLQRRCPAEFQEKLKLFLHFHPEYPAISEVPDPYYGGGKGFEVVMNLIEQGCDAVLDQWQQNEPVE